MNIKSYIINLKSSENRRAYMESVMAPLDFLDTEFIEAVDGRRMSPEEVAANFDQAEAVRHYGRQLRPGEIGCTLSHKKCAAALLASDEPYALIFEDDLVWQTTQLRGVFEALDAVLRTSRPTIVLLSGDYWYRFLKKLDGEYRLASVSDAVCAQAYFINRAAAEKLLGLRNWHVADDWQAIRGAGIRVKALYPHVADQNREEISSDIAPVYGGIDRKKMALRHMAASYLRSALNKFLVAVRHFEAKNFKWK